MQAPTLFVIAQDLTRMQVSASIDEADIGQIAAGQAVSFRVDAYPDETFAGTVSQVRLQPTVEQNVVSYTTVIDVPNPGAEAETGHDGQRNGRGSRRADDVLARPERRAAIPPVSRDARRPRSGGTTSRRGRARTRERGADGDRARRRAEQRPPSGRVWVLRGRRRCSRVRVRDRAHRRHA